jgi:hypothetical protein
MTPEQQSEWIRVMQFGYSIGIQCRFQTLIAYTQSYPDRAPQAISAAAALERGCGMSHEQSEALREMNDERYWDWVQETYAGDRRGAV